VKRGERFQDRADAGRRLATRLSGPARSPGVLVLALPRGGVPVGFELARVLPAELDVFLVRKLGVPGHEELAMGAIASGGMRVLNSQVVEGLGIPGEVVDDVSVRALAELARRERVYRGARGPAVVAGRPVIVVDDGLATGATMRVATIAVRELSPSRLAVAVPVAAREACEAVRPFVDEVTCLLTPEPFIAVGEWYADFPQVDDEEVGRLLTESARFRQPAA
jgi:predicted phosphoribosyltransferase